jgi:lysozyme
MKTPAQRVAAVLAAAAVAVPVIAAHEGYVPVGYPDPGVGVSLPTACYGHTGGVTIGKRYSQADCEAWLAQDAVRHGMSIAGCLPDELPIQTRAAFTSFAYNIGPAKFCSSSLSRRAQAGDLRGACKAIGLYVYAGTRKLPGLVKRRAAERALCEAGLRA